MATPDERGRRTWRFRLNDTSTLEVSTPPRATEKQVRRRGRASLIVGTVLAALTFGAVLAYGDNVVNDVSADVNGDKIITVTAGGAGATVNYWIVATGGSDGQVGCNASDGSAATVTPTGLPAGATKSPSSLSFTACKVGSTDNSQGITYAAGPATTPGDYPIVCTISDSGTGTYNDQPCGFILRVVGAANHAPVISSVTNDGPVNEGSSATITVTASDQDGDTLSYEFDCDNDATYEIGPQASYQANCSFADGPANATVGVRVSDGNGGSDTGSTVVTVNNVAPTISSLVAGAAANCGSANSLTINFTDPAGANDTYSASINWGDGNTSSPTGITSGGTFNHPYSNAGPHTVTVTVSDEDGGTSTSMQQVLIVNYNLSSILQPINDSGHGQLPSVFKYGSTIPVKVEVTDCDGSHPSNLALFVTWRTGSTTTPVGDTEVVPTSQPDSGNQMRFSDPLYVLQLNSKKTTTDPSSAITIWVTIDSTKQSTSALIGFK